MTRSTRLFEIIQLLRQAQGPITARAIADQLEVSIRTIYRDIVALQSMRLPIEGEAGLGYIMRPGFDLPPLMFSAEEVEAITVGLALLGRTADSGLEHSANSVAAKISSVLPDEAKCTAPLFVSNWNPIPGAQVKTSTVRKYIRGAVELRICYCNSNFRSTEREIKPIALVYYIDAVLIAAWCGMRQDFRHFRLDRIKHCMPTGKKFLEDREQLLVRWKLLNKSPSIKFHPER